jgi:hypothetical protein
MEPAQQQCGGEIAVIGVLNKLYVATSTGKFPVAVAAPPLSNCSHGHAHAHAGTSMLS